eukprot:TRINITY_DN793_c0_g1_i1.p1 TRINITY_DN793_c0_g1~~TRINITY_DN793_c0_g1_i1.p1  ORF type:complete len:407 (-),score=26.13 TRINITY_DN793_c0_g1_i1:160-1344(-)
MVCHGVALALLYLVPLVQCMSFFHGANLEACPASFPQAWLDLSIGQRAIFGTGRTQQIIQEHQHPLHCRRQVKANTKQLLVYNGPNYGIGSYIHVTGALLALAMSLDRILVFMDLVSYTDHWADTWCANSSTVFDCYFDPFTSCPAFRTGLYDAKVENYNQSLDQTHTPILMLDTWLVLNPRLIPKQVQFLANNTGLPSERRYFWWRAQTTAYFVRPNKRTRVTLLNRRHRNFASFTLPPGTVSVHVRHGDKFKEAPPLSDKTYLDILANLRLPNGNRPSAIFLSTEDAQTVKTFRKYKVLKSLFVNVRRLSKKENMLNTTEVNKVMGGPSECLLNAFLNLQLALESDAWILTLSSNWCRMIDELRVTAACKADMWPMVDAEHVVGNPQPSNWW